MISVLITTHNIPQKEKFLARAISTVEAQTYRDYEIVVQNDDNGEGMAANTNNGIRKCKGDIIKLLNMDDMFAHENALQIIADNFAPEDYWLATGCVHTLDGKTTLNPHIPEWNVGELHKSNNSIGGLSVIAFRNNDPVMLNEKLSWVVDIDWYERMAERSLPKLVNDLNVCIQWGPHQTTYTLSEEYKNKEAEQFVRKYHPHDDLYFVRRKI